MKNLLDPIKVKEKYIKWLEQEISVNKIGEYLEITSPFLDRYNDFLQIYAKLENDNEIFLTDDAYTINNLKMSGIDINSLKRKQILENFLMSFRYINNAFSRAFGKDIPFSNSWAKTS